MGIGKLVLLVDDEECIIKAIKRELFGWAKSKEVGFLSATSAEVALDILKDRHEEIGLIISDQKMPGKSGTDLLVAARMDYPGIQGILLTGFAESQDIQKLTETGALTCLHKPWDHDLLVSEIERGLGLA